MPPTLRLPRADGTLASYTLSGRAAITPPTGPITSRIGMAAVHVVADPVAAINPTLDVALDWDATLCYRHYVWSLGLAVAEAMDTSQRGMGFDWPTARELIRRSVAEARTVRGAVLASGAGTDQLAPGASVTLADVEAAYEDQCSFIEGAGGRIRLLAAPGPGGRAVGGGGFSRPSPRWPGRRPPPWTGGGSRAWRPPWPRRSRCPATSSARRRASTRRASCSLRI